jgi:hypothetical protein
MDALIHRFRPQRFLPRVVQDAARLYELTESWGAGETLRAA